MKYLILFPMFFSLFGICYGENLYIDTVIMETSSGADLGNANAKEVMNDIFKLEKEILMQILPQLGIKFEKLSPKVKSKLLKLLIHFEECLQILTRHDDSILQDKQ